MFVLILPLDIHRVLLILDLLVIFSILFLGDVSYLAEDLIGLAADTLHLPELIKKVKEKVKIVPDQKSIEATRYW